MLTRDDANLTDHQRLELERRLAERRIQRRRAAERRRRRARIRRNRLVALLAAGLSTWLVVAFALGGTSTVAGPALKPKIRLTSLVGPSLVVPGRLGPLTWPATGQGAVSVLGTGLMAASPAEHEVPIASLTKMMTALVVLKDHPIPLGGEGPTFTMDASDVAAWVYASQNDESNVAVQKGEQLTEQQLLEALLIPSADNIADYLATWDAGSIPAFVAKMNATARALGLHHTSYADASGVNPKSRSTAADQAIVAATLMENPTVRSIVAKPSLAFPVQGTIWNYNPALGTDGIVGIKSGYTSEAQGCLATASYRRVGGRSVLVVAVTLGNPAALTGAAQADETLLDDATAKLRIWQPSISTGAIARATQGSTMTPLALAAPADPIVAWPGLRLRTVVVASPAAATSATVSPEMGQLQLWGTFGPLDEVGLVSAAAPTNGADAASDGTPSGLAEGG